MWPGLGKHLGFLGLAVSAETGSLSLGGMSWGRIWGGGLTPIRRTPVCLVMREDLEDWTSLAAQVAIGERGAMFFQELARSTRLPPVFVEEGLRELIALGRVTCATPSVGCDS